MMEICTKSILSTTKFSFCGKDSFLKKIELNQFESLAEIKSSLDYFNIDLKEWLNTFILVLKCFSLCEQISRTS